MKPTILVADDEPSILMSLQVLLRKAGFEVEVARDGQEAFEALKAVVARFPKDSIVPYNLACYACQLGDQVAAQNWILMATRLRPKDEIRAMGLDDPDLKPLRDFLKQM